MVCQLRVCVCTVHSVVSKSLWPLDCSPPDSSVYGILQAKYWSGLPFPTPGDLPIPGIKPVSLASAALASKFFTTAPPGLCLNKKTNNRLFLCSKPAITHHFTENKSQVPLVAQVLWICLLASYLILPFLLGSHLPLTCSAPAHWPHRHSPTSGPLHLLYNLEGLPRGSSTEPTRQCR